jgi:hypothetical protein
MNTSLRSSLIWLLTCLLIASSSVRAQNLALNKAVLASSTESASFVAANAVDGNTGSRWGSTFSDPQYLIVDLGSVQTVDRIHLLWETAYGKDFTLDISTVTANPSNTSWDNVVTGTWTTMRDVRGNSATTNDFANLGKSGRYVRMRGTARATGSGYGYSLFEFEVYSTSPTSEGPNLALNKPATATLSQTGFPKENAFDGNEDETGGSRWGSEYSTANPSPDSAFIYVDLQSTANISRIYLHWETAYGKDFKLEVSDDAQTWRLITKVTGNSFSTSPRINNLAVTATGRYVRMHGLTRAVTTYGYSLWEFKVFGALVTTSSSTPATPLPVTLASFSAAPQGTNVVVRWATASEQHNAGFEVQRSATGSEFTTLAYVAGSGTTQTANAYHYLDAAPLRTTSYYRLKQVDTDGTIAYSPVVAVAAVTASGAQATAASLSLYPSPVADRATVEWTSTAATAGCWSLTTATGQVVHKEALRAEAGLNTLAVDLLPYPSGSYVLTVEAAGQAVRRARVQKVN